MRRRHVAPKRQRPWRVEAGVAVRVAIAAPLLVTSTVSLLLHVACRFDATWAHEPL